MPSPSSIEEVRAIVAALQELYAHVWVIQPHDFFSSRNIEAVSNKIAVPLSTKLADAQEVLGELQELSDDNGVSTFSTAADLVSGCCFAARSELRRIKEKLDRLIESEDIDELVVYCDSVRSRIRRAVEGVLHAVDPAFAKKPAVAEQAQQELDNAIGVRAAYAEIRQSLRGKDNSDPLIVNRALAALRTQLESLVAEAPEVVVRLADLVMLRKLNARIGAWFSADANPSEGKLLYKDVETTMDLLRGINNRIELRTNDGKVVGEALDLLGSGASLGKLGVAVEQLQAVRGRDDELDEMLARIASRRFDLGFVRHIRSVLQRLHTELQAPQF